MLTSSLIINTGRYYYLHMTCNSAYMEHGGQSAFFLLYFGHTQLYEMKRAVLGHARLVANYTLTFDSELCNSSTRIFTGHR